jgi:hypothetical protein
MTVEGGERVELGGDARHRGRHHAGDEQPRQAERQLVEHETRDDVVDVPRRLPRHPLRQGERVGAHGADACLAGPQRRDGLRGRRRGRRPRARRRDGARRRRAVGDRGRVPRLERAPGRGLGGRDAALVRRVVQQRRALEVVEHEHQHADEQDERLERDLPVGAHEQRRARLVDAARVR